VMAADRPYGEFYDFYSVSEEYFVYTLLAAVFEPIQIRNFCAPLINPL
jgi:hypothetical protein